jgi:hypothetical protein
MSLSENPTNRGDQAYGALEFWAHPVGRVPSRGARREFSATL